MFFREEFYRSEIRQVFFVFTIKVLFIYLDL